jgi:hypothetical protein
MKRIIVCLSFGLPASLSTRRVRWRRKTDQDAEVSDPATEIDRRPLQPPADGSDAAERNGRRKGLIKSRTAGSIRLSRPNGTPT